MAVHTCTFCLCTFTPASRSARGTLCSKPECRTAFYRELGQRAQKAREAKKGLAPRGPIQPICRGFRTVLQPQIAPYIASLAAASKSMETRA